MKAVLHNFNKDATSVPRKIMMCLPESAPRAVVARMEQNPLTLMFRAVDKFEANLPLTILRDVYIFRAVKNNIALYTYSHTEH